MQNCIYYNHTPPRLLFLRLASDNPGGSQNQMCYLAEGLKNTGLIEPLLVSDREGFLVNKFKEYGIPTYIFPNLNKLPHLMTNYLKLARIVKENNVKVVQSHTFREDILLRGLKLLRPGIKHIYRPHTHLETYHHRVPPWKIRLYHNIDWLTQGYVDRYVCIANCIKEELITKSGTYRKKILIISNGAPGFQHRVAKLPSTDEPLDKKVAIVSRLVPRKGHDVLFRAVSSLKNQGMPIEVRVIGGGSAEFINELRGMSRHLGIEELIEFYGYTNDIPGTLSGTSVVVLPSCSEVLPNAILEAWSLRKVVVASEIGAVPEMIIDGKNGYLHPPNDEDALAKVLKMIFTVPAHTLNKIRLAGEETWRSRFCVENLINKFIELYREIGVIR